MSTYPEIECLKQYFKDYNIHLEKLSEIGRYGHIWVLLSIDNNSWKIYVDDEYQNFDACAIVAFYLTVNALEQYRESPDFLAWANENYLSASDSKWLSYYKSLETIFNEIEETLGEINSHVSAYDYNLQTDLGLALLKTEL